MYTIKEKCNRKLEFFVRKESLCRRHVTGMWKMTRQLPTAEFIQCEQLQKLDVVTGLTKE